MADKCTTTIIMVYIRVSDSIHFVAAHPIISIDHHKHSTVYGMGFSIFWISGPDLSVTEPYIDISDSIINNSIDWMLHNHCYMD
jgi:hypothetical protein